MKQYIVSGMTCASCQNHVEKAVKNVEGVTSATVSLLTNTLTVEGSPDDCAILSAVAEAGYEARPMNKTAPTSSTVLQEDALQDRETPALKRRLLGSLIFVLTLMYITMGAGMWGWPLPSYFQKNYLALTLTQMLMAIIVMQINKKFFMSGFRSLFHGAPNMDTLVALGSTVSFAWSLYVFYQMCSLIARGGTNAELMSLYHGELYFEGAAMIPTFITVGKML